jgi:hypothetical protein
MLAVTSRQCDGSTRCGELYCRSSVVGPSRQFAAALQLGRFWSEADIAQREPGCRVAWLPSVQYPGKELALDRGRRSGR